MTALPRNTPVRFTRFGEWLQGFIDEPHEEWPIVRWRDDNGVRRTAIERASELVEVIREPNQFFLGDTVITPEGRFGIVIAAYKDPGKPMMFTVDVMAFMWQSFPGDQLELHNG